MATFTQLRLGQLSGSFGTASGQMNDLLGPYAKAAHSGSEQGKSLADHLSHVVSAIKRIHGASEFSTAATGSFTTSIFPATSDGAALGAKDKEWSDLYLADGAVISLGDDDDTTLTHTDGSGIAINSTNKIGFGGNFNAYINHDGTDLQLVDDADINIKPGVDFLVDAGGDIILDADGGDVTFKDGGTSRLIVDMDAVSGEVMITNGTDGDDIKFSLDAGSTEIMRLDDSASSLLMASTKKIEFGSANAYIHHDGTDLKIADDADINLVASTDILLDAGGDIIIDAAGGDIDFKVAGTAMLQFTSGSDVVEIQTGATYEDLVFKEDGGTEVFRMDASAESLLMASGKELQFADDGEHISGDGSTLSIVSEAGSIAIGAALADGQTLKLGKNGAVETIIAPHGTAGSEKYSVTNTAGTAADAILLDSAAGGVTIKSANTTHGVKIAAATSGVPVTIGHSTSEVTVADNLNVVGDLIVQGATTTVSSSNLVVQDSIIGLGVSGSEADDWNNVGDRGIIFARGAAGAVLPGLWWDGTNFNIATSRTSPASASFGAVDTYSDLKMGNLYPGADDTFDLGSAALAWQDLFLEGDINFSDGAEIDVASGDLTLDIAGDITINADGGDVTFSDGSQKAMVLKMDSTAGDAVFLDAGDTEIFRIDGSADSLLMASTKKIEFGSADAFIHHDGTDLQITDNADIDLSAGAEIRLDAPTAVLMEKSGTTFLKFNSGSESGTAEISAPNSTYADIVFKGNSAGEVFRLDDSADSILLNSTSKLQLGGTASSLSGDGTDATLTSTGNVNVTSTVNESQAIYLRANGGTSETIRVHSDQGTGVASILVDSDVGGIKLQSGLDNAASIHLSGYGITFTGNDVNDSVYFENSPISLEELSAGGEPSSTGGKLYNVTGSLVWAGKVIAPRSQKVSYTVTGSHAATDDLVISGLSHDRGVNSLTSDVYLNGQLMLSGASSTTGDYKLSGTVTNVRFHFALEADDVVTVINMG